MTKIPLNFVQFKCHGSLYENREKSLNDILFSFTLFFDELSFMIYELFIFCNVMLVSFTFNYLTCQRFICFNELFGTWLFNMSMPLPYTQENSTIIIRLWFWQWR